MNRLFVFLIACSAALLGQTLNISLAGSIRPGATSFSISGTGYLYGIGNDPLAANLSGFVSTETPIVNPTDTGYLMKGVFAMAFGQDRGLLYGTFSLPRGIIAPSISGGATSTGMGSMEILGGLGRFEGACGTIGNISGAGVAGMLASSFTLTGSGDIAIGQKILPQFAYGGGWYTALYFANPTPAAVSFPLLVTANDGSALTVPGFPATVSIPAGGSVRLEALNSGDLSQGYVTATLPASVTGYAVFRQSVAGAPDQEAVVPLSPIGVRTNSLTFDDTSSITAAAIVNPGSSATTVTVTAKSTAGEVLGSGTIALNALSKTAATLRSIPGLAGVEGKTGTATFTVASGSVAVLGLRFTGAAFTSIPATDR